VRSHQLELEGIKLASQREENLLKYQHKEEVRALNKLALQQKEESELRMQAQQYQFEKESRAASELAERAFEDLTYSLKESHRYEEERQASSLNKACSEQVDGLERRCQELQDKLVSQESYMKIASEIKEHSRKFALASQPSTGDKSSMQEELKKRTVELSRRELKLQRQETE